MILWKKFLGKSCTKKLFEQGWGNSGKILRTPKICLLHLWWKPKRPLRSRCPSFERTEGECPRHASILRRLCAYYSSCALFTRCRLQCVTAMNINYYQWSPKTEQFTTAKVSGNALKYGSRTHSVLRQRSSQLQKYKSVRICCIAGVANTSIAIDRSIAESQLVDRV